MTTSPDIAIPSRGDGADRRRHPRCQVAGLAILHRIPSNSAATCQVSNLSVGGALLVDCPAMLAQERCRVTLVAPLVMAKSLMARIVRAGTNASGEPWAAVEFLELPLDVQEMLARIVEQEVALATTPAVLVVDSDECRLSSIGEQLARHSRRAVLAMRSANAIAWLEEPERYIGLAMIGASVTGSARDDLLEYIGQRHRDVHRACFDRALPDHALRQMLDRMEAEAPVHEPWRLEELE